MNKKNHHVLLFSIIVCIIIIVLAFVYATKLIKSDDVKEISVSKEPISDIGYEVGVLIIYDNHTQNIAGVLHEKLGGEKMMIHEKINDPDKHNYIFVGTGKDTNKKIQKVYDMVEKFDVNGKYIMPYGTDEKTDYDILYNENILDAQLLPAFEFYDDYDAVEADGLVNGWIDTVFSRGWDE